MVCRENGEYGSTPEHKVDKVRCGTSPAAVSAVSALPPSRRPRPVPPVTGVDVVARPDS